MTKSFCLDFEILVDRLRHRLGEDLIAVYLYGSFAHGQPRPDSDVDLAVLTRQPVPQERLFEMALDLAGLVGRDVDLVDLNKVPTVLQMQIISHGHRLYCGDLFLCERFEAHVLSDYVDLNERRAGILQDIRNRGSVYG